LLPILLLRGVVFVCLGLPPRMEDFGGPGLLRVARAAWEFVMVVPAIFSAAAIIGIATGTGESHLQELASQIGADEIACVEISLKLRLDRRAALLRLIRRLEPPQ